MTLIWKDQNQQHRQKLVVVLVNPFARDCLRQRRNLVRELGQRIEPGANLFRSTRLPGLRRTHAKLLCQNLLDVRFQRQAPGFGLGSEFVGDVDSNYHEETLTRNVWPVEDG